MFGDIIAHSTLHAERPVWAELFIQPFAVWYIPSHSYKHSETRPFIQNPPLWQLRRNAQFPIEAIRTKRRASWIGFSLFGLYEPAKTSLVVPCTPDLITPQIGFDFSIACSRAMMVRLVMQYRRLPRGPMIVWPTLVPWNVGRLDQA